MAHREEILAAVLARWGTRQLAGDGPVPWSELEDRLEVDLAGSSGRKSRVRFGDATPAAWLDAVGASRLALLPHDGAAKDPMLHAFAGTGGLCLGAVYDGRVELFGTRMWMPPRTTLTAKGVFAFIESQPDPAALRESLLWQDEYNLQITDGKDWDRFVAALTPAHDEAVVDAMGMAVGNARYTQGEQEAWSALVREHRNPDCDWQYDFVDAGSVDGPVPAADVAGQRGRLDAALAAIEAFARDIDEPRWADGFAHARALLTTGAVPEWIRKHFGDCMPGEDAFRLVAASLHADVFGGMGSWNDLVSDDPRYPDVSGALFRELRPSLITAVNS